MKKIILSFCFCLSFITLFAQDETTNISNEFGISATYLIDRSIDNVPSDFAQNPYFLIYKRHTEKFTLRSGLGATYDNEKITAEGFADSEIERVITMDGRVGIEWEKTLTPKWKVYYGADLVYSFFRDVNIVDSGFDKVTLGETAHGAGLGPVVGFQYFLANRVSLATEGSLYAMYNRERSARIFENYPQFDDEIQRKNSFGLDVTLPAVIYLSFHF